MIEFSLSLTRITFTQTLPLPIRQLSGVLLEKYVKKYWSPSSPEYVGPTVEEDVSLLGQCLQSGKIFETAEEDVPE